MEILYKYGGVFLDADSICIEPIDDVLMSTKCFAGWGMKNCVRINSNNGISTETSFCKETIEWMKKIV